MSMSKNKGAAAVTDGMRIVWHEIPEGVDWVVQDSRGEMWGCRVEPVPGEHDWYWDDNKDVIRLLKYDDIRLEGAISVDDWRRRKWRRP
jgi:hypothetical protein